MKKVFNDFNIVCNTLRDADYECQDLSTNELAKVHGRYLAGGRKNNNDNQGNDNDNERLFKFIFPESPGALDTFLNKLEDDWNVSLFHYRNHGDDFGRVLVGLQVPKADDEQKKVQAFLDRLGYTYLVR
jgi:threonine dehydratase